LKPASIANRLTAKNTVFDINNSGLSVEIPTSLPSYPSNFPPPALYLDVSISAFTLKFSILFKQTLPSLKKLKPFGRFSDITQ
jgi:hypothetical protein